MGRLLVISGVPASGKSNYCLWLTGQGWRFINHDRVHEGRRPIDQTWWSLVRSGRAAEFVQLVQAIHGNIALEFGFPIGLLPQVRLLKAAGAQHWWFEANHEMARQAFIARNEEAIRIKQPDQVVDLVAFENYIHDIAARQDEIRELFAPKIIETLKPDRTRMTVEEIHRQVLAGSTWPAVTPGTLVKVGRNDLCWCGSGKKFKRCHGR